MQLVHDLRSRRDSVVVWAVIFAVVAGFYMATFSFRRISDTDLNSYQTRALALHGDIDLTRFGNNVPRHSYTVRHQGSRYSIYGVGVSISAVPIYAVAARAGASDRGLQAAGAIPFVAGAVVILLRLLLRLFPRGIAIGSAVVYAFGTTMWPLASMAYFQHGHAALYQTLGLTGLFSERPRAAALAGFGFGAAAMVRPTMLAPLVIFGLLYLLENRRDVVLYGVAAAAPIIVIIVQNRWIWGRWTKGGYAELEVGYNGDVPRALWGLLVGWYRGIFAYSPVLAIAVVAAFLALRRVREPFERRLVALALSSSVLVIVYARFTTWHGGQNQFGYRYLLDIVPFLIVLMAYGITRSERLRFIAIPFGVLSIMTMAFGAAPSPVGWDGPLFPKGLVRTSLGQAWLVFVNYPIGSILRLAGVAAIAVLLYRYAPRPQEPPRRRILAPAAEAVT